MISKRIGDTFLRPLSFACKARRESASLRDRDRLREAGRGNVPRVCENPSQISRYSRRQDDDDRCVPTQWFIDHNLYDNVRRPFRCPRLSSLDCSYPPLLPPPVFTVYDKYALIFRGIEKNEGRARLLYGLFSRRVQTSLILPPSLSSLPSTLSFSHCRSLRDARRCLLISRANPASNFGCRVDEERVVPFLSGNDRGFLPEVKQILSIANRETNFWPFQGDQSAVLDVYTRSIRRTGRRRRRFCVDGDSNR